MFLIFWRTDCVCSKDSSNAHGNLKKSLVYALALFLGSASVYGSPKLGLNPLTPRNRPVGQPSYNLAPAGGQAASVSEQGKLF